MNHRKSLYVSPIRVLLLVVFMAVVAACASQGGAELPGTGAETGEPTTVAPATSEPTTGEPAETPEGNVSHGNEVGGYVELVDALRAAGAIVEPAGEIDQPFFGDSTQVVKVNGEDVQVFEFADEETGQAAAGTISANGYIIGTTSVSWVSQPYFWYKGRVIVLYVGTDEATINLLTQVLGQPITS